MYKTPLLAPSALKPAPYLYFVNAPVDALVIGGASVLFFFACLPFKALMAREAPAIQAAAFLLWAVNWPHFAATNWRLYHSRENLAQYPLTAFAVPALLAAVVAACYLSPERIAPYFVKLYLIWSPYHFSGQTMGLTLLYARRAGFSFGRVERYALAGFVFGTFIVQTALSEVGSSTRMFYSITYPSLGLPHFVGAAAQGIMWISGTVFLLLAVRWCIVSKKLLPPIVLLPAVTQFVWFVLGSRILSFYEFVPFFHGLQYLFIAWGMQLKETLDTRPARPSVRFVFGETGRWYAGIFVLGAFLFWLLPRLGTSFGMPLGFTEPVIIAAVQVHHFFVDGVIWKLRNPKVSAPLLVNIEQLVGKKHVSPAV